MWIIFGKNEKIYPAMSTLKFCLLQRHASLVGEYSYVSLVVLLVYFRIGKRSRSNQIKTKKWVKFRRWDTVKFFTNYLVSFRGMQTTFSCGSTSVNFSRHVSSINKRILKCSCILKVCLKPKTWYYVRANNLIPCSTRVEWKFSTYQKC
jgi:malate/lactate dehydrogenase